MTIALNIVKMDLISVIAMMVTLILMDLSSQAHCRVVVKDSTVSKGIKTLSMSASSGYTLTDYVETEPSENQVPDNTNYTKNGKSNESSVKARNSSESVTSSLDEPPAFLHHQLSLRFIYNGSEFHLIVRKQNKPVTNHIRVEQYDHGVSMKKRLSTGCFYYGKVVQWEESTATVDVCNNYSTIISYNGSDIYVKNATVIHDNLLDDTENLKFFGDHKKEHKEKEHSKRSRRAAYHHGEKYLEVLVVTDSTVADFHGRSVLEQYIITQMNIVDSVYHEPSLGMEINVVVVKILIVDDSTASTFAVYGSGKKTLDRFCEWAYNNRPSERSHTENFDIALYITRKDIGPAGYAPVTGMCNPKRSCAVNKDAGVSSAFVIAHEIGHVFGMKHDGYDNHCTSSPEDGKVMAPTVQANFANVYWSSCSSYSLQQYTSDMHCLGNKPRESHWPDYSEPYGQTWTMNEQCRQEFGDGYEVCKVFGHLDLCETLWCSHRNEKMLCKTKRGPPLPGTTCGHNKWCMDSRCVSKPESHRTQKHPQGYSRHTYKPAQDITTQRYRAVDGSWSTWSHWGHCSQECDVGVRKRDRKCSHPAPAHGGKDCTGYGEEVQLCNIEKCARPRDQRAVQCSKYDGVRTYGNRWNKWIPMESNKASDQCKLTCVSLETGEKITSDSDVQDGTKCSYKKRHDICVMGECHEVGCDGLLSSGKKEDQCGVCGGDGSTCHEIKGELVQMLPRGKYHKVLTLPAQARDIFIREKSKSQYLAHFFAIKPESSDRKYTSDNKRQSRSTQIVVEGSKFKYHVRGPETISTKGPLLNNVEILIYSLSSKSESSIEYKYTIPQELVNSVQTDVYTSKYKYSWRETGWSECSATCDGGSRIKQYECFGEKQNEVVDDDICQFEERPEETKEVCNSNPCKTHIYEWETSSWSECTKTCGRKGIQLRTVTCMQRIVYGSEGYWKVDNQYCKDIKKPTNMKLCYTQPCPSAWQAGEWSECSTTCGYGTQTRNVFCRIPRGYQNIRCTGEKPSDLKLCEMKPCPDPTTPTTSTTTTTLPPTTTSTPSTTKATTASSTSTTLPSTTTTTSTTLSTTVPTTTSSTVTSTTTPTTTTTPKPTTTTTLEITTATTTTSPTTTKTTTIPTTTKTTTSPTTTKKTITLPPTTTPKSTSTTTIPTTPTTTTKPTTTTMPTQTTTTSTTSTTTVLSTTPTTKSTSITTSPSTTLSTALIDSSSTKSSSTSPYSSSVKSTIKSTRAPSKTSTVISHPITKVMNIASDNNNLELNDNFKQNNVPKFTASTHRQHLTDGGSGELFQDTRRKNGNKNSHRRRHHRQRSNNLHEKNKHKNRSNRNNRHQNRKLKQETQTAKNRFNTRKNQRRMSMFSIFQNDIVQSRNEVTTVQLQKTTTTNLPEKVGNSLNTNCSKDRSLFCKMELTVEKCQLRLYAMFCCHSCGLLLRS